MESLNTLNVIEEFFENGVHFFLNKTFTLDNYSIFQKNFEETIIKEIYLIKLIAIRKVLNGNSLNSGDKILLEGLSHFTKLLFERIEKEIDSAALKADLSPRVFPPALVFDKNTSDTNLIKLKLINAVFMFILSEKTDLNIYECKKQLLNGCQCLKIASNMANNCSGLNNFISRVIYEIPGIEKAENQILIKIMEEILIDLEEEEEFLSGLQKKLKIKNKFDDLMNLYKSKGQNTCNATLVINDCNRKLNFNSILNLTSNVNNNGNGNGNVNNGNLNVITSRRKASYDKSYNSPEREREDVKFKNNKIDRYFLPKGTIGISINDKANKDFTFNSSLFASKKLNLNLNLNKFNTKKSLILDTDISSNNINLLMGQSPRYTKSDYSFATFGDKIKSSPHTSQNENNLSLSKQSSLTNNTNPNSNTTPFSLFENSKTITETNIKRPFNISGSGAYNFSSAKSTNFSQISLSNISNNSYVSQFSFDPLSLQKSNKTLSIKDTENSLLRSRNGYGVGLNSILSSKINNLPKTKRNSGSRNLSNKKKILKEKSIILEKFKEKCGNGKGSSNSKNKNSSENRNSNIEEDNEKRNFKKIIAKKFYKNMKNIEKSPDADNDKLRAYTQPSMNEMLSHKRKQENLTRSRSVSNTDDEVLVYQTPVKVTEIPKLSFNGKLPSPKVTTRKNLFNLFNQID